MSVGDVAGLIAAIAFVLLVGVLAVPLVKLGRVFDETTASVKELTDAHRPGAGRDGHAGGVVQHPAREHRHGDHGRGAGLARTCRR